MSMIAMMMGGALVGWLARHAYEGDGGGWP